MLGLGVMATAASAGQAQEQTSAPDALANARQARSAAERRLAELTAELDRLSAEVDARFAGAAELAADLEHARGQMRRSAIAAFVGGGSEHAGIDLLAGEDLAEVSRRHTFASSRTSDWAAAADRFAELKEANDPELVALTERRELLNSRVAEARDALFQAGAHEADAERAVVAEAEARAARREAERQAAAEAARATTAPRAASGAQRSAPTTAVVASPASTSPPRGRTEVVSLTEPSAPLPEIPPGGPSEEQWAALRRCESGGNYRIVSSSGRYRGAYQFNQQTWESVGGRGDPAAALPAEQDARAKLLYLRRGARSWPHCGSALR